MTGARAGVRWGLAAVVVLVLGGCSSAPPAPAPAPPAPVTVTAPPGSAAARAAAGSTGQPVPDRGPAIPSDLLLPDEGESSTSPEFTDWLTENGTDRTWLLDPCSPTAWPTDQQRTSFRTVSRTGPEAQDARQLAIYPSPEVAAEVLAGFRRALTACSTGTGQFGARWQWVTQDVPDLGDDGLLASSTEGGPELSPAGDRVAVARTGSAVFLAYGGGEFSTAEIDGASEDARAVVERFLASL